MSDLPKAFAVNYNEDHKNEIREHGLDVQS